MRKTGLLLIGLPLITVMTVAIAETDPDSAIKYRKNVMSAVGGNTSAMVAILKGEVPHIDALKSLSDGLVSATDPAVVLAAFQQNTDGEGSEKTTATGKIWEDWARYEQAVIELNDAAKEIQTAAANGSLTSFDQLKPALGQCGYCHRESGFREKVNLRPKTGFAPFAISATVLTRSSPRALSCQSPYHVLHAVTVNFGWITLINGSEVA